MPPSASIWLARYHIIGLLPQIETELAQWEAWFADIEESHTSNPALVFFRSPQPGRQLDHGRRLHPRHGRRGGVHPRPAARHRRPSS